MRLRLVPAAVAAAMLWLAAILPAVHAQSRRPMSLVDIAELPRVLDPQISPDGHFITYAQSHADWKLNRPVWNLWRQDLAGGEPVRLVGHDDFIPAFTRWSPDGKTIAFEQAGQIYLLPADGGEPRQLTKHATGVSFPTWSPDSTAIYFLAADARSAEERERTRVRDDLYAYDENFQQRHLWKILVATGAEQAITSGNFTVASYRVSRDGKHIAFQRAPSPLAGDAYRGEVWTMDATGQKARAVTSNNVEEFEPELSPDNSQILFVAAANAKLEPYYNQNLFVVPASGGIPRALFQNFPYEIDRAMWTARGRIIAVVNMGVHSEILQIDPASGAFTQLTDGAHGIPSYPAPGFSYEPRADQLVFLLDEPTRFGDVHTLSLTTGKTTRVTSVYDTLDTTFALPRQERVSWKSADGTTIEGLVFYPADYDRSKRYPLVVQLHGGPAESDKFGAGVGFFQSYFPVLTGKGYLVFRPNYRGSAGYGNESYRDVVGQYFRNQPSDILTGVDNLIAQGLVDPDQMVLMGWSAGAHLANKLITMTSRFKAASSGAGAANWISMYAQTDDRSRRNVWFGGTPWQRNGTFDEYWNSSPLKDIANATTPTLLFVGDNDPRVPMAQSIEMYQALKSLGVPTRLLIAPREGHQWAELRHLLAKANAELEWFEKYARGRAYTSEKTP